MPKITLHFVIVKILYHLPHAHDLFSIHGFLDFSTLCSWFVLCPWCILPVYSSDTFLLLIIYFYCLSKKKKEERKNMRNELQQQSKTKMSDTFKKPVNRSPTNESYLSIRIRVPHVQPYMNAYNLRIKSIKIVVKRHLMNDNNLQRSPTKFNYPSGFLWFTSQSSKSIVCSNPSIKTFVFTCFMIISSVIYNKGDRWIPKRTRTISNDLSTYHNRQSIIKLTNKSGNNKDIETKLINLVKKIVC